VDRNRVWLALLMSVMVATLGGCESEEGRQARAAQAALGDDSAVTIADDGTCRVETTICRKISRKSGRPIGKGRQYTIAKKSSVYSLTEFSGLRQNRVYSVHLCWIRPDGKEMFRRYAEVELSGKDEGYVAEINWKRAEDLHYVKQETFPAEGLEFSLSSRFNIAAAKNREPGNYLFRVYLDRRLLVEEPFEVLAPQES